MRNYNSRDAERNRNFITTVDRVGICKEATVKYRPIEKILSISLAEESREMYVKPHSGKLSKNEKPGTVRQ